MGRVAASITEIKPAKDMYVHLCIEDSKTEIPPPPASTSS